jgi:hypothetical protein
VAPRKCGENHKMLIDRDKGFISEPHGKISKRNGPRRLHGCDVQYVVRTRLSLVSYQQAATKHQRHSSLDRSTGQATGITKYDKVASSSRLKLASEERKILDHEQTAAKEEAQRWRLPWILVKVSERSVGQGDSPLIAPTLASRFAHQSYFLVSFFSFCSRREVVLTSTLRDGA